MSQAGAKATLHESLFNKLEEKSSKRTAGNSGSYKTLSRTTGPETFVTGLAGHPVAETADPAR